MPFPSFSVVGADRQSCRQRTWTTAAQCSRHHTLWPLQPRKVICWVADEVVRKWTCLDLGSIDVGLVQEAHCRACLRLGLEPDKGESGKWRDVEQAVKASEYSFPVSNHRDRNQSMKTDRRWGWSLICVTSPCLDTMSCSRCSLMFLGLRW